MFCDCFQNDTANTNITDFNYCPLLCNPNCISSNCDYCGSAQGVYASKYTLTFSATNVPFASQKVLRNATRPSRSKRNTTTTAKVSTSSKVVVSSKIQTSLPLTTSAKTTTVVTPSAAKTRTPLKTTSKSTTIKTTASSTKGNNETICFN